MVGYPKKGKGTRRNICIFFVWKGNMPVVCPEESPQYALPLPPWIAVQNKPVRTVNPPARNGKPPPQALSCSGGSSLSGENLT